MAVINHSKREINAKIVLYGPPHNGKGSLLRFVHQRIKPSLCSPLKTMVTGGDTLLFFDYTPFESSSLDGYRVCFHLYTLTGRVENPGTWKMLLKGVDGIALISAETPLAPDTLAPLLAPLRTTLGSYGKELGTLPMVVLSGQDGDLPATLDQIAPEHAGTPVFACSAARQERALSALADLSRQVMAALRARHETEQQTRLEADDAPAAAREAMPDDETSPVAATSAAPVAMIEPGALTTLRIPVMITVNGAEQRYTLSATLKLEAEDSA